MKLLLRSLLMLFAPFQPEERRKQSGSHEKRVILTLAWVDLQGCTDGKASRDVGGDRRTSHTAFSVQRDNAAATGSHHPGRLSLFNEVTERFAEERHV